MKCVKLPIFYNCINYIDYKEQVSGDVSIPTVSDPTKWIIMDKFRDYFYKFRDNHKWQSLWSIEVTECFVKT